jgi:aminoglycoside phosphotransferase family enzyme
MSLTEAFLNGKIEGLEGKKPKHIATAISNVFVFDSKVYKVYKSDNKFFNENFNDLSDKKKRFSFTRKDFDWNARLSPEIYTALKGAVMKDGRIEFTDPKDDSEELVIEMNKVDMSNQLLKRLVEGRISLTDCYQIGKQFGERVPHLPKLKPVDTAYKDFLSRYEDIRPWIGSAEKYIPKEEAQKYLSYIKDFIESHKSELDSKDLMGTCMDIHADNAVFIDNVFLPIDTYAPKEAWLHGYKFINIYRLATDIYVFLGKKHFEEVLRGYQDSTGETLPRKYNKFLITYHEMISWPYHYMLHEKELWRLDVAKRIKIFLEDLFDTK